GNFWFTEDQKKIDEYLSSNSIDHVVDRVYGFRYEILEEGDGIKAKDGDRVKVNYSLSLLDGTVIDEDVEATFTKGARQIIDGLEVMLILLRKGDSVRVYVPSPYAFADQARGSIPANSILVYDLEIVDITYGDYDFDGLLALNQATIDTFLIDNEIEASIEPFGGVRYVITEEGSGPFPKMGEQLMVRYTGRTMSNSGELNETPFDSNVSSGNLFNFLFDHGRVIQGWDLAFGQLSEGTKARIFIPSPYGYRNRAQTGIPANSILVFDVEFVRFAEE
ncbi:MAG: FKBP-type peptidyl-prolyl cis-trans isomerase, partial [Cyclobacteriaceae bacterium]